MNRRVGVTQLELEVDRQLPASTRFRNGTLPKWALPRAPGGDVIGTIVVWLEEGYLHSIEYTWFSDEYPTVFLDPDSVVVVPLE
jgi:hypothetical protein